MILWRQYMTSRRSLRKTAMFSLYQYLLLKKDIREILEDLCEQPLEEIDPYILDCVIECLEQQEDYVRRIDKSLKEWSFNRLGYIEQSILLLATHEILEGKADKAVVINEAIVMAKEFCDEPSYRLINGVLDEISN